MCSISVEIIYFSMRFKKILVSDRCKMGLKKLGVKWV